MVLPMLFRRENQCSQIDLLPIDRKVKIYLLPPTMKIEKKNTTEKKNEGRGEKPDRNKW